MGQSMHIVYASIGMHCMYIIICINMLDLPLLSLIERRERVPDCHSDGR